jgi:hypothetical protein
MKSRYLLILFLVLISIYTGYSQNADRYTIGINTGYAYATSHFLQVEAIYGKDYGNVHVGSMGYGVGTDLSYMDDKFTIGPKAFVEFNPLVLFGSRIGLINYISQGQSDFRLLPEVGISLLGYANLMYGYSIPLLKTELDDISKHRFGLSVNLYRSKQNK